MATKKTATKKEKITVETASQAFINAMRSFRAGNVDMAAKYFLGATQQVHHLQDECTEEDAESMAHALSFTLADAQGE